MQERKVREERTPRDFYTGSLKPELHSVCQDNLSLTLHYFKVFTLTQESNQHSKNPLADLENLQAHTQSLRKIKPEW